MDCDYDLSDGPDGAPGRVAARCIGGRRRGTWIPQRINIEADKRQQEADKRQQLYQWPQRINMEAKKEPMAAILPNPFALKSNSNHRYLKCVPCPHIPKKGVLKLCSEEADPNFTIENARIPGYVNIKYVPTGKFLRGERDQSGQLLMIVATADTPDEDIHKAGCTLFQPLEVENNETEVICRIVHVQSHRYIRPHNIQGEKAVLCAVNLMPDSLGVDLLTAVAG